MEQNQNLTTIGVVIETLLEGDLKVWMVQDEDGNLRLPALHESPLDDLKSDLGFSVMPLPFGSGLVVESDGHISSCQTFVRSGSPSKEEGVLLIPLAEAWQALRGSGQFMEAEALNETASRLSTIGYTSELHMVMPLSEGKTLLVERQLTTMSKILLFIVGAWLVGKFFKLKVRGSQQQISTLASAMMSSKRFQDELKRPGASLNGVLDRLKVKNMDADRFQKTFGIKWPV
jgi:hypothetical protein